jgi:phenylacetate-coenzyme A ligase PaaK-like adenylate-forming protein
MQLERLRQRFNTSLQSRAPIHLERKEWNRARIEIHQRDRLRELLAHAIDHSPFHAHHLSGVDPHTFELDQLPSLPPMTKADMMAAFDHVVTDPKLTRNVVESHLDTVDDFQRPLHGEYFVVVTGGSSGSRGLFVYDWSGIVDFIGRIIFSHGPLLPGQRVLAYVGQPGAMHAGCLGTSLLDPTFTEVIHAPVSLPLGEIVRRLNAAQPNALSGYPNVLYRLAAEQEAGRLSIRPARISSGSENLRPEAATYIESVFGVPVINVYGASEGLVGACLPGHEAFTFASDLAIVEPVDENNRPVPPGTPSARVLVTNLYNTVQPLIRFAIDDRFVERPAGDQGHFVAKVEGRTYQVFSYGDTHVHPQIALLPPIEAFGTFDYQVRQTSDGVDIDIQEGRDFDEAAVTRAVRQALSDAGLPSGRVSTRIVERIEVHPQSGKVRRFVPLQTV